jgi:arylsulfatase A-like enzyme
LIREKTCIGGRAESCPPFFTWVNFTHMHTRTHTKPKSLGQAGVAQSYYHDAMIDHDKNVGQIVDLIDQLGIADNTIVIYSTDNGPHQRCCRTSAGAGRPMALTLELLGRSQKPLAGGRAQRIPPDRG